MIVAFIAIVYVFMATYARCVKTVLIG